VTFIAQTKCRRRTGRSNTCNFGWIHESYRGHPLVVHNGAIDGFTVHLGFLPETGQGLILLMNRDLATATLMALAYSAYDHLLGLEPLDWETRLVEETLPPLQDVPAVPLDFPLSKVEGDTSILCRAASV
jgi:hypothetical protein